MPTPGSTQGSVYWQERLTDHTNKPSPRPVCTHDQRLRDSVRTVNPSPYQQNESSKHGDRHIGSSVQPVLQQPCQSTSRDGSAPATHNHQSANCKNCQSGNMSGTTQNIRIQRAAAVPLQEHHDDKSDRTPHSDFSAHHGRMLDATDCPTQPEPENTLKRHDSSHT